MLVLGSATLWLHMHKLIHTSSHISARTSLLHVAVASMRAPPFGPKPGAILNNTIFIKPGLPADAPTAVKRRDRIPEKQRCAKRRYATCSEDHRFSFADNRTKATQYAF